MFVPISLNGYIMFLCYINYTCNQYEFGKLHYEPCFQIEFEGHKQRFLQQAIIEILFNIPVKFLS